MKSKQEKLSSLFIEQVPKYGWSRDTLLHYAKKLGISTQVGKGYRALVNVSEDGGQEVPHLHFHLFGGERVGKMVEWQKKLKEII